ncbi:cell division protein FtsQ/DivIB [Labrys wisconsinensis]|uniref:Cell division protein FtsQ n=1 Tax=Labrys wisconsinensis TaxID=425677 RepID=A0ABU0JEC4_9HYPH|nr:cell division protein FtsQ/DivIB [Labrys wisconsinensis]MDQ0471629.1 cell division protein FtsQ [Labrys wisconsinensis]
MPRLSLLTSSRPAEPEPDPRARRRRSWLARRLAHPPRGVGVVLALALIGATGYYGGQLGGGWQRMVAAYGTPADMIANACGFRIDTVAITGQRELTDQEILGAAGVTNVSSLLFLDAEAARERLQALPLVKTATVHKLYPDTLSLSIEERQPYGLWQKDGAIKVISADGTPIDDLRDGRFSRLPFLVGDGANVRAKEIAAVLDQVPALKARVRAAVLVAERRWNLALDNGVLIRLPEEDPAKALAALAGLEAQAKVLEKDVLIADLRMPDRVAFRLSEDAAAARAAMLAKRPKKKADPV